MNRTVETIKLDGTGQTVVKQLPERAHPWLIDVFEEMMMWSDRDRAGHIYFDNRFTGEVIKNIRISQPSLNGMKIVQAALQTSGKLKARYLRICTLCLLGVVKTPSTCKPRSV